jgi:hypothetical protein
VATKARVVLTWDLYEATCIKKGYNGAKSHLEEVKVSCAFSLRAEFLV